MKAVITGASGFVGRELTRALLADENNELVLFDAHFPDNHLDEFDRATCIQGELEDAENRSELFEHNFDVLFHLAAVPGGASEADPALSRRVNLEATLDLFEEAADSATCPRIVYTSTIGVLAVPMPPTVDDSCPIIPGMIYGAHKAMMEIALADMSRRGKVDAVTVRLPGILARPLAPSGRKSAYRSNVFHALTAGEDFISPVSERATMWIMSVQQCAVNLIHAAGLDSSLMPATRVVTLPAIRASMGELVDTIAEATGNSSDLVSWNPDADLEALFGTQPPLSTPAADKAGFSHEGSLKSLVENALQNC